MLQGIRRTVEIGANTTPAIGMVGPLIDRSLA
jgi:hypothetical protein